MAKQKIAIIGNGNVGSTLNRGLKRVGEEVRIAGHEPNAVREAATWGEVIILAIPYRNIDSALEEMGNAVNGKVLVDVTNVLTADHKLALGFTTSGAEELQKKVPQAKVVKAFNTIFAEHMADGKVKGNQLSLFIASDDRNAKEHVQAFGRELGFDVIDAGPLANARWLETLGYLNIQLGFNLKMGRDIGFKLIH